MWYYGSLNVNALISFKINIIHLKSVTNSRYQYLRSFYRKSIYSVPKTWMYLKRFQTSLSWHSDVISFHSVHCLISGCCLHRHQVRWRSKFFVSFAHELSVEHGLKEYICVNHIHRFDNAVPKAMITLSSELYLTKMLHRKT